MSTGMLILSCNKCDFRANSSVLWGARSYVAGDRRIPVGRILGWCEACATFEAIEDLPTPEGILALERRHQAARAAARSAWQQLKRNQFWLARMFGAQVRPDAAAQRLERRAQALSDELFGARKRRAILADRTSPPRCLQCGATTVQPLPGDMDLDSSEAALTRMLAFRHPGCGGQFFASPSPFSMSVQLTHRLYDLEGRFIGDLTQ